MLRTLARERARVALEDGATGERANGEHVRSLHRAARAYGPGENSPVSGNYRFMQIPGVHIETLHNPTRYSYAQIEKACTLAALLNRGKLVLVEPPRSR